MSASSGLVFVDPLPVEDVGDFYRHEYREQYKQAHVPRLTHIYRAGRVAFERYRRLAPFLGGRRRVLDAGAGGGEWLYLLQSRNHDVMGIEPHVGYARFATETYGLEIHNQLFAEVDLPSASFDAVTLFHVLEHLQDPVAELRSLASHLKPDGRFVLEVPNILFRGMSYRTKWHKGHLFGFDLRTLRWTAEAAGLVAEELYETEEGANLFGVFRKGHAAPDIPSDYPRKVWNELQSARSRYYFSPVPYTKPLWKWNRRRQEKRSVVGFTYSRDLLDHLYGTQSTPA